MSGAAPDRRPPLRLPGWPTRRPGERSAAPYPSAPGRYIRRGRINEYRPNRPGPWCVASRGGVGPRSARWGSGSAGPHVLGSPQPGRASAPAAAPRPGRPRRAQRERAVALTPARSAMASGSKASGSGWGAPLAPRGGRGALPRAPGLGRGPGRPGSPAPPAKPCRPGPRPRTTSEANRRWPPRPPGRRRTRRPSPAAGRDPWRGRPRAGPTGRSGCLRRAADAPDRG